jgi:hypothetical protein
VLEINRPEIFAEVSAAFRRYEEAFVANDVAMLNELFWKSPLALRFGVAENLYGYDAIVDFRLTRVAPDMRRRLMNTLITTYGNDLATANTEFQREGATATGRQSQVWLRTSEGWRIVAAHVSLMPQPR